jgi:hypothetical protein
LTAVDEAVRLALLESRRGHELLADVGRELVLSATGRDPTCLRAYLLLPGDHSSTDQARAVAPGPCARRLPTVG